MYVYNLYGDVCVCVFANVNVYTYVCEYYLNMPISTAHLISLHVRCHGCKHWIVANGLTHLEHRPESYPHSTALVAVMIDRGVKP